MDIRNFSSLFELFCVFNFAYILTEPYRTNDYILQVADRVLRCFSTLKAEIGALVDTLEGHKISLVNLSLPNGIEQLKGKSEKTKSNFEIFYADFYSSKKAWEKEMSMVFKTPSFVYLNFLLAIYCLVLLFISGLYDEKTPIANAGYDSSLLCLNCLTLLFLIIGWFIDSNYQWAKTLVKYAKHVNGVVNWFILVMIYLGLAIGIATLAYYEVKIPYSHVGHNTIICSSIVLPSLNFIIYFFKIRKRASKKRAYLTLKFQRIKDKATLLFQDVNSLLITCSMLNEPGDMVTVKPDGS